MAPALGQIVSATFSVADALLGLAARLLGWRRAPHQPTLPFSTPVTPAAPKAGEGAVNPHELAADLEAVAAACEKAVEFSRADIVQATGLGVDVVKRRFNVLMDMGWIERAKHSNYHWKGRVFWQGGQGRGQADPGAKEN